MIDGLPLLAWPAHRQALTILIYHRVLPQPDPLRPGEVDAQSFAEQMRFLARYFTVLPLADAVVRLQQRTLPRRTCCITFDDGYADNLTVALPILERYSLPATVFVATGYLDGGIMFNDAVIECIARAAGPLVDLSPHGLGVLPVTSAAERRAAVSALLGHLKYCEPADRDELVGLIAVAAGSGPPPADVMLTSAQLWELAHRGVEIGGHTVAHTILTTLADHQAYAEIAEGRRTLQTITGKTVRLFAYPNGRPQQDFAARHVAMVRELGFAAAVTTAHGVGNPGSDAHQLPRFTPWGANTAMLGVRMMRNAWTGEAISQC